MEDPTDNENNAAGGGGSQTGVTADTTNDENNKVATESSIISTQENNEDHLLLLQDLQASLAVVSQELEREFKDSQEKKDRQLDDDGKNKPREPLLQSHWKAAAVGGFLSLAQSAVAARSQAATAQDQTPKTAPTAKPSSMFAAMAAGAHSAAQTSAQVAQKVQ